jgi:hypothetical protein
VALLRERGRLYSALTERLLLNAVRMDSGKPTVIRPPPKPLLQLIVRVDVQQYLFRFAANELKFGRKLLEITRWEGEQKPIAGWM